MNLSINIYDLFANAIPGSLYLAATIYVAVRFGWVDMDDLAELNTTFALVGAVVAAYLLGQIVGTSLRWLLDRVPLWQASSADVRDEFCRRNPTMADRLFLDIDVFTLLAGLRQVSPQSADEVDRSRAQGIMLRSACPAFLIGAVIAGVEAVVHARLGPAVAAIGLLVMAALALYGGHKRSRWARIHTYECVVWLPDIDARLAPPPAP